MVHACEVLLVHDPYLAKKSTPPNKEMLRIAETMELTTDIKDQLPDGDSMQGVTTDSKAEF